PRPLPRSRMRVLASLPMPIHLRPMILSCSEGRFCRLNWLPGPPITSAPPGFRVLRSASRQRLAGRASIPREDLAHQLLPQSTRRRHPRRNGNLPRPAISFLLPRPTLFFRSSIFPRRRHLGTPQAVLRRRLISRLSGGFSFSPAFSRKPTAFNGRV